MFEDLKGKVVLLTGASMGLGRQQAKYYYKLGMKVSVCARRLEKLQTLEQECLETGADGEIFYMQCDVSDREQLQAFVDGTVKRFGTIHHLVNNANLEGILVPFEDQGVSVLRNTLRVGPLAHFRLIQMCFPYMKENGGGSVIDFVSSVYQMGMDQMTSYVADKGAIRGLAISATRELGRYGIRLNTVAPSAITDTIIGSLPPEFSDWAIRCCSVNALERVGKPEDDIPPVVAFFMSSASQWVNGQNVNIDGGYCVYGL